MSIFHWYLMIDQPVDIHFFYETALNSDNWFDVFGIGSQFIAFLIYPLVKIQASYFTLFLLFSLMSLTAYVYLFKQFIGVIKSKLDYVVFLYLILLPSIHFWTGSFSKEAILMPLMFYVISQIKNSSYKSFSLYFSLLLILLVRPYLFLIVLMAFIFSVLLDKSIQKKFKFKWIAFVALISIPAIPLLLRFLKIDNWGSISQNYNKIALYASENGNTSIELLKSNYLERLFLTLFRPFFYDVINVFHFFASIENVIFLLFMILLFFKIKKVNFTSQSIHVKFAFFTAILLVLFYSIYMYNLGLANRMKVMFLPFLVYVFLALKDDE